MKPQMPMNPLTDAQLDGALTAEQDQILPSSGFADAVMTSIRAEAAAPAPIPFPWKRAIPGLVCMAAGVAVLVALVVQVVSALMSASVRRGPASVTGKFGMPQSWNLDLATLLHFVSGPDLAWITLALAIPFVCLFALRRLIFSR